MSARYVPAVTVYGNFSCRTLTPAEALDFAEREPRGPVTLMLGAMREGYLGRELVTVDDLERWVHEDHDAAAWQDVTDGERFGL